MKRWLIYYAAILALVLSVMATEVKGQDTPRRSAITGQRDGAIAIDPNYVISGYDGEPCVIGAYYMNHCDIWPNPKIKMAAPDPEERELELAEEQADKELHDARMLMSDGRVWPDDKPKYPAQYDCRLDAECMRSNIIHASELFADCDQRNWPVEDSRCNRAASAVGAVMMTAAKEAANK